MYAKFLKRLLDFILSLIGLIFLSPVLLILMTIGIFAMQGNPFFLQKRPGKNEKIFRLIKFRTMSNATDQNGCLLPDSERVNQYGIFLRKTSLDELPELLNILSGSMSFVGPRPQLVRDMVFMTSNQRQRHDVTPGLTGLAQINGRNSIPWEEKLQWDLRYIDNGITFREDLRIMFKTVGKVLEHAGITRDGAADNIDLGVWLLQKGEISQETYQQKLQEAQFLLSR